MKPSITQNFSGRYPPGDIVCPDGVDIDDLAELCEQWLFEKIPADVVPPGGDGIVNFADFAVFADQWGVTNDIDDLLDFTEQWLKVGPPHYSADISPAPDGDGIVNFADFAVLANYWLQDTAFANPFVGTRVMTIYGDDDISDGVTIESNEVTVVTSTSNNTSYTIELIGGPTFSMARSGDHLLALNPQPQYFDTRIAPNVYMSLRWVKWSFPVNEQGFSPIRHQLWSCSMGSTG